MNIQKKNIALKHLLINGEKKIGLKFYPDKVIQALIKELPSPKWSKEFSMVYLSNTPKNFNLIFSTFKGVAWINLSAFSSKRALVHENQLLSVDSYRKRVLKPGFKSCPEVFLQKLELKGYVYRYTYTHVSKNHKNEYSKSKKTLHIYLLIH